MQEEIQNSETPEVVVPETTPDNGEGDLTLKDVVEELKEIRKERGIFKELYEGMINKETVTPTPEVIVPLVVETEIQRTVREALAQQDESRVKATKQATLDGFIAANKEYSTENDPTGLKRAALEKKLSLFNTSGITDATTFLTVIKDAHRLAGGSDSTPQSPREVQNPYSITPTSPSSQPLNRDDGLTDEEKKIVERTGFSAEKLLKLKTEKPDFYRQIMRPV